MFQKIVMLIIIMSVSVNAEKKGNMKALELRKLALKSSNGLIKFDNEKFEYFVQQEPRPYDVVMFFTTNGCTLCDQVQQEYKIVQEMYRRSGAMYPNNQEKQKSVFFGIVSYSQETSAIFAQQSFTTVPNIVYYSSKLNRMKSEVQKVVMKDYQWVISGNDGHITSSKILEYINQKSKRNIVYKEPITNLLFVMAILGCVFVLFVNLYRKLYKYFLNPKLWFVVSTIVYITCLSGVVYTVIQGAQFTQKDNQGNLVWFQGGRGQLGMEGVVMSVSITIAGFLLLTAVEGSRQFDNKSSYSYFQQLLFLICMSALLYTLQFIDQMHQMKQNYQPTFYPPAHFIRGPLNKDQGNSF